MSTLNTAIQTDQATVFLGDSLKVLKELPENSVDSVITDPPYELGFMGKGWDKSGIAHNTKFWAECLRVLKPGGFLLSFGGSRTYHRMACAVEDAGFEIRDSIQWLYGSGFPKSHNVSKTIDKAAHATEAKQWEGWGTALKPGFEPVVVARKPLGAGRTVANNVLTWGTGAINIDECRVGSETIVNPPSRTKDGSVALGGGCPATTPTTATGRFPANVILSHSMGCVDTGETVCEHIPEQTKGSSVGTVTAGMSFGGSSGGYNFAKYTTPERNTVNSVYKCEQGCPIAEIDKQSGIVKGEIGTVGKGTSAEFKPGQTKDGASLDRGSSTKDMGGASRFFYHAKAGKRERPVYTDTEGNRVAHPTVKPLALMQYLCRLVTQPGGVVLDPFAGSGTTIEAAILEGFHVVGIELTDEYIPLIQQRLDRVQNIL